MNSFSTSFMSHRMHLSSLLIAQLYGHCKNGRGLLLRSSQRMRQSLLTDLLSISCIRSWWLRSVQFSCHQALHSLISPMDHKPGLICFAGPWFGVPVVRVRLSRCTRWYTNDKFPYRNKCFKFSNRLGLQKKSVSSQISKSVWLWNILFRAGIVHPFTADLILIFLFSWWQGQGCLAPFAL